MEAGHGDGPVGDAGRKIRGAIERVDHPVGLARGNAFVALFAEHPVLREQLGQPADEGGIAPAVAGRDQGAVGLEIGDHVAEISPLAFCHPVDKGMEGRVDAGVADNGHDPTSSART